MSHLAHHLVGAFSMLFSGIDLHKRSLVIHTLDAEGVTARGAKHEGRRQMPPPTKLQICQTFEDGSPSNDATLPRIPWFLRVRSRY